MLEDKYKGMGEKELVIMLEIEKVRSRNIVNICNALCSFVGIFLAFCLLSLIILGCDQGPGSGGSAIENFSDAFRD